MFEILLSIIIFGGVFSFLVVAHELGHYLTARWFGIGISEFSVGFGNLVYSFKDKLKTQWSLRALPFGGYVAILDDEHPEVKGKTIYQAKYWQKLIIYMGGPFANILTAFVLTFLVIFFAGFQPTASNIIEKTQLTNLQPQDKILTIDGFNIQNWKDVQINLANKSKAIIAVERVTNQSINQVIVMEAKAEEIQEEKKMNLISKIIKVIANTLGYKTSDKTTVYKWNIEPVKFAKESKTFSQSIVTAFTLTIASIIEFFALLQFIASNGISMLSGPIGIAKSLTTAASAGVESLTWLTIKLSMSLGLFNLLPLPMLDGGQVLLASISKLKGSNLSHRFLHFWSYLGLVLIGGLMIYVSIMDILK